MTDRDKLIEYIHEGFRISAWHHTNYAEEIADCLLANDVAPVRHGEWMWNGKHFECSRCRRSRLHDLVLGLDAAYCPYCGAKMDGGKRE